MSRSMSAANEAADRVQKFVDVHAKGRRLDEVATVGMGVPLKASDLAVLLADRQHWINVAAAMGNHEARALAPTKG